MLPPGDAGCGDFVTFAMSALPVALWFFVFIVVVVRLLGIDFNQKGSAWIVAILLLVLLYYISRQESGFL